METDYSGRGWPAAERLVGLAARWRGAEGQFDYQNADRREVERRREAEFTGRLRALGAWIDPDGLTPPPAAPDPQAEAARPEASVVIPVRNRARTIEAAVRSALAQQAAFDFNVIVVDNHSTDGTAELLRRLQAEAGQRLVVHAPAAEGHGIGGCWNEALNHPRCGRIAVQLDSDDLYNTPHTLSRVVEAMRAGGAAMLAGAYELVDMQGRRIGPGVIAHEEWTAANGHNNLLRVNGAGAPRAFVRHVAAATAFPDVSYGEDYAMALALSARHRVARIHDVIYTCRRWEGNSDANLDEATRRAYDRQKDNMRLAALLDRFLLNRRAGRPAPLSPDTVAGLLLAQRTASEAFAEALDGVERAREKTVTALGRTYRVRLLPARAASSHADVSAAAIAARPCFLCPAQRPADQLAMRVEVGEGYDVLVNPRPIVSGHLTIVGPHTPQALTPERFADMGAMAAALPGYSVVYNGPGAGASAPDHLHFQAVPRECVPEANGRAGARVVTAFDELPRGAYNLECTSDADGAVTYRCWPRRAHRPSSYPVTGLSPGVLDLLGVVTLTERSRYESLDGATLETALREVIDGL